MRFLPVDALDLDDLVVSFIGRLSTVPVWVQLQSPVSHKLL